MKLVENFGHRPFLKSFVLALAIGFSSTQVLAEIDTDALFVPGEIIVQFDSDAAARSVGAAHRASPRSQMRLAHTWLMDVEPGEELRVTASLRNHSSVVFAEPNYIYQVIPCETGDCKAPDNVFFGNKWDLHNNGFVVDSDGNVLAETGKAGADVAWLEAYEYLNNSGMTFDSVRVGIIDTGVRASHHALAGKVGAQRNFCPALFCLIGAVNPDAYADDNGHGTHVSTTAAGRGDEVAGVPGVAWIDEVSIISGRVCGGPLGLCTAAGVANAIVWAVDEGADVLNLSLGGGSPSAAQQNALQYAVANNVLPVCASGNDGSNVVSFPAAFPECMAVGSSNWSDLRSSYSQGGPQLEVVAPGGDISDAQPHSLILAGWHTADNAYAYAGGTSMATPQVAGLAALLRATGTSSADAVRTRLQETADDLGDPGWDISFGYGRINAYRALTGMDPVIEFDMLMRPSINASANGNLQVVLYGQEAQTFSLEQIQVDSILLGVTPIAYRRNGTPFAVLTDNNGDGLTDLVMHFRIPDLAANGDLDYDAITLHAILDDGRRLRAYMEINVH